MTKRLQQETRCEQKDDAECELGHYEKILDAWCADADPNRASASDALTLERQLLMAGASPEMTPTTSARTNAKKRTGKFNEASTARGVSGGSAAIASDAPTLATATPNKPPKRDNTTLSVMIWRTMRDDVAPRAARRRIRAGARWNGRGSDWPRWRRRSAARARQRTGAEKASGECRKSVRFLMGGRRRRGRRHRRRTAIESRLNRAHLGLSLGERDPGFKRAIARMESCAPRASRMTGGPCPNGTESVGGAEVGAKR